VLTRLGPDPSADVARGTEEAFGRGLQRRELPPGAGPQRWTADRAAFTFRDLAPSALTLVVEIRDSRGPVTVVADGVVVGRLEPGARSSSWRLPPSGRRRHEVELWSEPFRAGDGRLLGARLGRVALEAADRSGLPPLGVVLLLSCPVLCTLLGARACSMRTLSSLALALASLVLAAVMLWPSGLVHSPYALRLSLLLSAGSLLALAFSRLVVRRFPSAGPAAFVALAAAWSVQVVLGTSPVMVVSDAVFHANKLAAVAAGDLFPVSVTQHARPFRFPYGVSFYAVLAPLARAGLDTLTLVRAGAALFGLAASAAVFLLALAELGPLAGAWAAVLLQVLPGAFDIAYSYGNLSNAFGQSVTVLFFCWWAGQAPGRWPTGGALLAVAALAHFSSFVVALALVAALVASEWRAGDRDRTRLWAAAFGVALAVAYYAHFAGLVWEQVPRLVEGSQGRGASRSIGEGAWMQVLGAVGQWGLPAIALAMVGRPRLAEGGRYARSLAAWWVAGLALAIPAIVSPLEVRYLYGLTAAVALAAADGVRRLEIRGGPSRLVGRVLCAAQLALGARAIAADVLSRYRP
jgi:hypothetical protein